MVVSAERRAVREPGASPGRSRRCEGRRSPAKSHWPRAGKAAAEGTPSQKTCRSPETKDAGVRLKPGTGFRQLLAEGGFVSQRSLSLLAVVAALLVLVPAAFAARVHVRVEGKTQTIFGSTEPTLNVKANALDALEAASLAGEFYYHVASTAFGPSVDQIGRYPAGGSRGWICKV